MLLELAPRCRIAVAPFYPWIAFAVGAWGLAEIIRSARYDAAPTGVEALTHPSPSPEPMALYPLSALSPREYEVASAAAEGLRNAEIAERLFISLATVKKHLANAMEKADCRNRVELSAALRDRINPSATAGSPSPGRSSGHGGYDER
jgi:DNA-binding CsgD family transcriptional regulator